MDKKQYNTKIGLYFGSFNPIHNGHLILAEQILENTDLDQIWFVVTPQNPLKKSSSLLDNRTRLALVRTAIADNYRFKACDIEFSLPVPSYTINTLTYIQEKYPDKSFSLIIGEDNLNTFHKWKNHSEILKNYRILVYPRNKCEKSQLANHQNVLMINAPEIEISSSLIRENIRKNKSIRYLLPESVRTEIEKGNYYKNQTSTNSVAKL